MCRWACESSAAASKLPLEELGVQLGVQVLFRQDVSRETLLDGQRVIIELPISGLREYCSPLQPFSGDLATVDLTACFIQLFASIDATVDRGTYPDQP